MAIKVGGTDVITNARQLSNIASVDSATVTALSNAGVGSANSFDATMTGSVADGKPMILKTDGTLSAITQTLVAVDPPQDSGHVNINGNGACFSHSIAFHPVHKRSVTIFRDGSDSNRVKLAIIDGGDGSGALTMSGNPTTVSNAYAAYEVDIAYDPITENFVSVWRGTDNNGYLLVFSIASSGSTITLGSVTIFSGDAILEPKIACGNTSGNSFGNAVVVWHKSSTGEAGEIKLFNIEANKNVVARTSSSFNTNATSNLDIGYDPDTDRFLVVYRDENNNSGYATCKVVEVANNTGVNSSTLATGASTNIGSNDVSKMNTLAYDTAANKMVVFYWSGSRNYARVGTITGGSTNSISFGSEAQISSTNAVDGTNLLVATFDTTTNKIVVFYKLTNNAFAKAKTGTVSGTSISFSSNEDDDASVSVDIARLSVSLAYDTSISAIIYSFTEDAGNDNAIAGKLKTGNLTTDLTTTNYIGIADAAYTNGQTATVQTQGAIDDAQSSLTIGSKYYVQSDGTIGTSAGVPSVEAGLAVSATKLLVKG